MQDDWVWVSPTTKGEFDVAVGAQVKKCENDSYLVVDDDGNVICLTVISYWKLNYNLNDLTGL